jgi:TadE-like protein
VNFAPNDERSAVNVPMQPDMNRIEPRRGRNARRARRDSGATLIEFAIIAPLLFALVFGIIDFGGVFNDWISLRQGARDGARSAVTGRVGTEQDCFIAPGSPAIPNNGEMEALICLVKERTDLPDEDIRVAIDIEGGNTAYVNATDDPTAKTSIRVCVMADARSFTGFYAGILDDLVLNTSVQMKVERTTKNVDATNDNLIEWQEADPYESWSCNAEAGA